MTLFTVAPAHDKFADNTPIGSIPVRNIWLLLLYASSLYKNLFETRKVSIEDSPDSVPDLVAEILAREVEKRLKRGLNFGYQPREEIIARLRGRIDHLFTERHQLLLRGKIACRFDELTANTVRNRLVRAALLSVSKVVGKAVLQHRCRTLALTLFRMGVIGERPRQSEVSTDRFGRNDANDELMVIAAELALKLDLPTEDAGTKLLSSPERQEQFWKIFEKGVAGFYDVVLKPEGWSVIPGKTITWQIEKHSSLIKEILPTMKIDIVLDNEKRSKRIVIDAKTSSIVQRGQFREEVLRSAHIYQIYAYLRSQEKLSKPLTLSASGLLLHPTTNKELDESVAIQNHEIRFATVNLAGSAVAIRNRLLEVVNEYPKEKYFDDFIKSQ